MLKSWKLGIICLGWSTLQCWSFSPSPLFWRGRPRLDLSQNSKVGSGDEESGILKLPALGASSLTPTGTATGIDICTGAGTGTTDHTDAQQENSAPAGFFVGSAHFQLAYTCNICETRNHHRVSRTAYRQGMVVATCKGCDSKHLIADNLGTGLDNMGTGESANIEDYFKSKGEKDNVSYNVSRVSPEVFELEKILDFDTSGGAIIGDDGMPVME
jgi:hypothetical protein